MRHHLNTLKLALAAAAIVLAGLIADAGPLIQEASKHCNLDPKLLEAIIMVESGGRLDAVNEETKDYGIGQINEKTAKAYGFNMKRLLTDKSYSLKASAIVLCDFKKRYEAKEPLTWFCRYNVGTRPREKVQKLCMKYYRKVMLAYEDL